jgi:hypothetical protein
LNLIYKKENKYMEYRVMYLRGSKHHNPVGCAVISMDRRRTYVDYQISVLNPKDKFDRKVARQLAIGRWMENPIRVLLPKNANMHTVSEMVMRDLVGRKGAPARAVKAAENWLHYNLTR